MNNPDDEGKIIMAIKYVNENSKELLPIEKHNQLVAFDLIFVNLVDEAKAFGIKIEENIYKYFEIERNIKLLRIEMLKKEFEFKNIYWFVNLEVIPDIYEKEYIEKMFREEKSISCSLSATCFALYKNYKLPKCKEYLKKNKSRRWFYS